MIKLFLSASIPLPDRNPKYFETADVIAIRDSVKALVTTVLDEGKMVFGGHPAITPLVALLLRGLPTMTKRRVVLYQSKFFELDFVEENDEFIDLRLTPRLADRNSSLQVMREEMIASEGFDAGIFIGGMEGISDEYQLFHRAHPRANCYPIASTGGAALELYREVASDRKYLMHEITYPTLFRKIIKELKAR